MLECPPLEQNPHSVMPTEKMALIVALFGSQDQGFDWGEQIGGHLDVEIESHVSNNRPIMTITSLGGHVAWPLL